MRLACHVRFSTACRPAPDFQTAFWSAKHALTHASATAFARHGVHEGQQFVLRCLWREDGLSPSEVARRLGLAEASCKTVVGQRLKQAGMHWTVNGADAIIALRCREASSQWEAICNTHDTQTRTA